MTRGGLAGRPAGQKQPCRSLCLLLPQIQCSIKPHAVIILPNTDGMELLVCYEDEGVYVNTYGRITKDVVLQWGEMPTSVGRCRSGEAASVSVRLRNGGRLSAEWLVIGAGRLDREVGLF